MFVNYKSLQDHLLLISDKDGQTWTWSRLLAVAGHSCSQCCCCCCYCYYCYVLVVIYDRCTHTSIEGVKQWSKEPRWRSIALDLIR